MASNRPARPVHSHMEVGNFKIDGPCLIDVIGIRITAAIKSLYAEIANGGASASRIRIAAQDIQATPNARDGKRGQGVFIVE